MARYNPQTDTKHGLINQVGVRQQLDLSHEPSEEAWIEVIQKMDEIYADLVHAQVEAEKRHAELDQAHRELQKAQQRLIASEKMAALGRLVSGVAHELNNPISFVFGNMHALRRYGDSITLYLKAIDDGTSPEALKELRQTLQIDKIVSDLSPLVDGTLEGAERASDIVKDLRAFSRRNGEPTEEFDLLSTLKTATNWVLKATRGKPQVVFKNDAPLFVIARKGHVHQIVVNLVQNAFDVMEDQDVVKVEIAFGSGSSEIWISVRDFGPGISEEHLPHIFEPFFSTKPVGRGTGMGLYVSYGMAEEQGGTLVGENHRDGGAIFTLRLPKADGQGRK